MGLTSSRMAQKLLTLELTRAHTHTDHTEFTQEVQSRSQNRKITVQWQKSTVLAGFDMNVWKVNSEQIMTSTEEVATSCGLSSTHTVQM